MYNLVISEIAGGDTFLGRASETKKDPCGGGGAEEQWDTGKFGR